MSAGPGKIRPVRGSTVGILVNPASGRDIRRLVGRGSVFPIAEKGSIVIRLLAGLEAAGVERVLLVPDLAGIAEGVRRRVTMHPPQDPGPRLEFIEMAVDDGPLDTIRGIERMSACGAGAIVVLGGDGTQRLAARACGDIPLMALSTGTNNVFPELREPTVAGLATGLVATGRVPLAATTVRNKVLRLEIDGVSRDAAVVDIALSDQRWVGSKALWRPEHLDQVFVAFARPDAIGISSLAGLFQPVSRRAMHGLRVDLAPPDRAAVTLMCPLAPGIIARVGIDGACEVPLGEPQRPRLTQGVIALDGERELSFNSDQNLAIRLDHRGPLTIDVDCVMALAAQEGLFALSASAEQRTGESLWN